MVGAAGHSSERSRAWNTVRGLHQLLYYASPHQNGQVIRTPYRELQAKLLQPLIDQKDNVRLDPSHEDGAFTYRLG
jgi:hypothetical protein